MPEDNKKLFTFRIEPALLEAMQDIQREQGVPVSEQVRRAIRAALKARGIDPEAPAKGRRKTAAGRERRSSGKKIGLPKALERPEKP